MKINFAALVCIILFSNALSAAKDDEQGKEQPFWAQFGYASEAEHTRDVYAFFGESFESDQSDADEAGPDEEQSQPANTGKRKASTVESEATLQKGNMTSSQAIRSVHNVETLNKVKGNNNALRVQLASETIENTSLRRMLGLVQHRELELFEFNESVSPANITNHEAHLEPGMTKEMRRKAQNRAYSAKYRARIIAMTLFLEQERDWLLTHIFRLRQENSLLQQVVMNHDVTVLDSLLQQVVMNLDVTVLECNYQSDASSSSF